MRTVAPAFDPSRRFTDQVMARLAIERGGWLRLIPTLWQKALPVAVLLAALGVWLLVQGVIT